MSACVAGGGAPGVAWLVAHAGEVVTGSAGTMDVGVPPGSRPVDDRSIFRISSMTKPVTAVAALTLVDEGRLALDDPVDRWLPELAGRRVLRRPHGPLDDTVPAQRAITLRDALTFRLGWGMDFGEPFGSTPLWAAMTDLRLAVGPPAPQHRPPLAECVRRLGTLPLAAQPGEQWRYHTGIEVVGALVERATGQSLGDALRERVFDPLGMHDTGFWVRPSDLDRFGPCYLGGEDLAVHDPTDGQWARPPAFEGPGDGLVSTVHDVGAFADALRRGGTTADGRRVLSMTSFAAMTTDHLTDAQRCAAFGPDAAQGWGLGVGVLARDDGPHQAGTYGWDGGLGTSWRNDPTADLVGVVLTNRMFSSPTPPPVIDAFWSAAYAAIRGAR